MDSGRPRAANEQVPLAWIWGPGRGLFRRQYDHAHRNDREHRFRVAIRGHRAASSGRIRRPPYYPADHGRPDAHHRSRHAQRPAFGLWTPADNNRWLASDDGPLVLVGRGADDYIGQSCLILKQQEREALGCLGPLTNRDHAGHANGMDHQGVPRADQPPRCLPAVALA